MYTLVESKAEDASLCSTISEIAALPFTIARRKPRSQDVLIDILYCGVCHSDIHQVRDDWGISIFL